MKKISILISACLVSFLIGRYVVKPRIEIKEVIKYVTVEVEKKKTKKTTKVIERKNPDGSSSSETTIVEDSSSERNSQTSGTKETFASSSSGLTFGVLALKDVDSFRDKTHYGVVLSAPLVGNLKATGYLDTTKRVGLGLGLEF